MPNFRVTPKQEDLRKMKAAELTDRLISEVGHHCDGPNHGPLKAVRAEVIRRLQIYEMNKK